MGYILTGMVLQLIATAVGLAPTLIPEKWEMDSDVGVIVHIESRIDRSTKLLVIAAVLCAAGGLVLQIYGLVLSTHA